MHKNRLNFFIFHYCYHKVHLNKCGKMIVAILLLFDCLFGRLLFNRK
uniref:Uncharacterized protein n=1 Tax=Anguilla anguilla TaxID=7936 RepID=A0A0E9WL47_ANGAN